MEDAEIAQVNRHYLDKAIGLTAICQARKLGLSEQG